MKRADLSRLALAAVLLLAAASVSSGCRKAFPSRSVPAAPAGSPPADRLLLTGELSAVRSADLFVPETPLWALQLRFLAEDGTAVREGDRVAEFDATGLTADLEQKRIAVVEAELSLLSFEAALEGTTLAKEQTVLARRTDLARARIDAEIPAELRSRREHEENQLALKRAETELASFRSAAASERAVLAIALGRVAIASGLSEGDVIALVDPEARPEARSSPPAGGGPVGGSS